LSFSKRLISDVCARCGTLREPIICIQMFWARPSINGRFCCTVYQGSDILSREYLLMTFMILISCLLDRTVSLLLQDEMAVNHSRTFKEPLRSVQLHMALYFGTVVWFDIKCSDLHRIMLSSCWNTDVLYYVDSKA